MTAQTCRQKTHTLQIHVTKKCNLKCLHCYSSSGPEETEMLDIEELKLAVRDAKALGFGFVTLSGGEPFLYPHMKEIMAYAKSLGLRTGAVTNGMFLDKRRLDALAPHTDLIVVSLDGAPERHNRMRANASAFEVMSRKIPALRESGIPFGFIFTLSRDNAHELDWAADFAHQSGAAMLQVHPLDIDVGRAAEAGQFEGLDPDVTSAMFAGRRAYEAQQRLEGKLRIVVDFRPRLPADEVSERAICGKVETIADQISTLCIETDGTFVPMGHGFSKAFALGRLGEGRLADLAETWANDGRGAAFKQLVEQVGAAADREDAPPLANIPQSLRRAAFAQTEVAAE